MPERSSQARIAAMNDLQRTVASAIEEKHVLNTGAEAQRIVERHPRAGFSQDDIARALVELGSSAGVPMRLSSKQ